MRQRTPQQAKAMGHYVIQCAQGAWRGSRKNSALGYGVMVFHAFIFIYLSRDIVHFDLVYALVLLLQGAPVLQMNTIWTIEGKAATS